jgi:hypothetical protein
MRRGIKGGELTVKNVLEGEGGCRVREIIRGRSLQSMVIIDYRRGNKRDYHLSRLKSEVARRREDE